MIETFLFALILGALSGGCVVYFILTAKHERPYRAVIRASQDTRGAWRWYLTGPNSTMAEARQPIRYRNDTEAAAIAHARRWLCDTNITSSTKESNS